MRDELLLDELGREGIERAIGDAVEGEEDGCCHHLDAELSVDEDDPDWEAAELVEWRVLELREAGAFLVALIEGEFRLAHPSEDHAGRICTLGLALVVERVGSAWSVQGLRSGLHSARRAPASAALSSVRRPPRSSTAS